MKNKFRMNLYDFLIVISAIGIIVVLLYLAYNQYQVSQEKNVLEQIKKQEFNMEKNQEIEESIMEEMTKKEKQILPEYKRLYEENNDLYGWIKIEGTEIDYPVMFTPENPNFYEDKNWKKEVCYRNVGTVIWLDGATTSESENTIIYGHNSKSYTMFRALMDYKDPNFYQEHKYIEFNTLYEKQIYEIISISKSLAFNGETPKEKYSFFDHIELNSKEEFDAYVQNAKQSAYYEIATTAEYGDKLITLSTCDYWAENARLIVVAKKI